MRHGSRVAAQVRGERRTILMQDIIRLCRLYSVPAIPARKASKGEPARKAQPARKGIFPVGKTKFFEDYVFREESDPNIPGTDVERIRLFDLGPKAKAATGDEITRVIEGLQRHASVMSWPPQRETPALAMRGPRRMPAGKRGDFPRTPQSPTPQ